MDWSNAVSYCQGLDYAGRTNWTLPSQTQLQEVQSQQYLFWDVQPDWYWSTAVMSKGVYCVNMESGEVQMKPAATNQWVWPCITSP